MDRVRTGFAAAFLLLSSGSSFSALAQDEMAVAAQPCMTVAGNPIVIPVYIRDVSGTRLGLDQGAGKKIEGISFQVVYTPANYVSSVVIQRAGVLAKRVAVSEFALSNANTVSYLGLFEEEFNTIQFHVDAPPPGDLIANLVITLSPAAVPGSRMDFAFGGPATTSLTDQHGVIAETETDGSLRLHSGCAQLVTSRRRAAQKWY